MTQKVQKKDPWQANEDDCKGCRYFGKQPIMCCNYYQITKVLKWEMPNECTRKEVGPKVKCDGDHDELLIHPDAKIDVDGTLVKIKRKDKMRDDILR